MTDQIILDGTATFLDVLIDAGVSAGGVGSSEPERIEVLVIRLLAQRRVSLNTA